MYERDIYSDKELRDQCVLRDETSVLHHMEYMDDDDASTHSKAHCGTSSMHTYVGIFVVCLTHVAYEGRKRADEREIYIMVGQREKKSMALTPACGIVSFGSLYLC